MNKFYDPFANKRKKKQTQKFFNVDQQDVKFEFEDNFKQREMHHQKVQNICKKFANILKIRIKKKQHFLSCIQQSIKNLQDLQTVLNLKPNLKQENFFSERFLYKFLTDHQQYIQYVKSKIITNIIEINGQDYIQCFELFLKFQNSLISLLNVNFQKNNTRKMSFADFVGIVKDDNLKKQIIKFFDAIKDSYQLGFNFYVTKLFQEMFANLQQMEQIFFLCSQSQNINQNFVDLFFYYFDDKYFFNDDHRSLYKNQEQFVDKLLLIIETQKAFKQTQQIYQTKEKIFQSLFINSEYFEILINRQNVQIFSVFRKEIIDYIQTSLNCTNTNKIQSNILFLIIIQFSKQQLELEQFITHNNLQESLQQFVFDKIQCLNFDSFQTSDTYKKNLIESLINKDQISSCLKDNYFQESNKLMVNIYSLFFYSLKKSQSKLILSNLLIYIIKNKELLNILQKSILKLISYNHDICESQFHFIILQEILRLRLMTEEEKEILQDFTDPYDFFQRLYNYLYAQVNFYGDLFYKKQQNYFVFSFQQLSQILQFILAVNDDKKFLQKAFYLTGSFDYDFIKDFYFFFDIEYRFTILRKSFKNNSHIFIPVTINRNDILEQGIEIYQKLAYDNNMSGQENIAVTFIDEMGNYEAGVDQGGLYKDFVNEFSNRILDPNLGYFIQLENRELYINPSVYNWVEFSPQIIYGIMGLLIARCFKEGFTLNKKLSRTFIRKIKGLPNYFKELKYYDKDLYKQLRNLKQIENIEDLCLTFTIQEQDTHKQIELIPNGQNVIVSQKNLSRYLYLYADYKMNQQVQKQFDNFQQGFQKVFNNSLLKFFSEKEVQLLINGTEELIDVEDLKHNTRLVKQNEGAQSKYIEEFWQVVSEFDQTQRRKLLKFVTNYERPPLFGFKNLHPQFALDINTGMLEEKLPTSSTCSNMLHLPVYHNKEILKEKLTKALEMTKGHYVVQLNFIYEILELIMGYNLETFKDFLYEMFCYQYPKTAFIMLLFWLIYLCIRVDCLVDFGWTLNHWVIGLTLVLQYLDRQNARTWISLGILTLWFLRLGGFLFVTRILTKFEDKRYKDMSGKSKNKTLYFLLQYEIQALMVIFTAIPLYFIFRREDVVWRWTFFVGGFLALIGIIFEGIADHQLNEYKKKKQNEKKKKDDGQELNEQNSNLIGQKKNDKFSNIFHEGLWRKSRHPNLFFELVTWFGFALMGLNDYTISFLSFLGPIFLWAIMYFLTIPISEKSMAKSRDNWDEYCKETNMFLPF